MLGKLWKRIVRSEAETRASERDEALTAITARRAELARLDDADVASLALELRARVRAESERDGFGVEGLALACDLARRRLGMDPFDEQVEAAIAMDQGYVVEMGTGEGKTLAAGLVAAVRALRGEGVHVLTANDYLAARDAEWMRPIHAAFGSTVASVSEASTPAERRAAYAADVTHATANEIGFDYLRDHLALDPDEVVHRPFSFAIVDEADSLMLDEARIPLVVAGATADDESQATRDAAIVRLLARDVHYKASDDATEVQLTPHGAARVEQILGGLDLYAAENVHVLAGINVALHAEALLHRDVDYIVEGGGIRLVDELKGRVADRRRWPDGIHAALEAKEQLALTRQGRVLCSMTIENLLAMYPGLCGMSGTLQTPLREIETTYGLSLGVIDPRLPSKRQDLPDRIFATREQKKAALIETITREHARGRPVLVGTGSVAESEDLAEGLERAGVTCVILNARHPADEAAIVARAGDVGAVTISTNMAGRGTDIRLGGPDEARGDEVRKLGGLLVLGTNRHDSRRIDDQLRGRAGRQGDPGQTQFFLSLEDDLIQRFGTTATIAAAAERGGPEDAAVSAEIADAQRKVEGRNHQVRTTLAKYWLQLEKQRLTIHGRREEWLSGETQLPLDDAAWERHDELAEELGEDVASRAARHVTLSVVDKLWAEHLAFVADMREGIHLRPLGMQAPLAEFDKQLYEAFLRVEEEIVAQASERFCEAQIGKDGVDLDREGLARPASTWTYIVSDQVYGTLFERMGKGLKRMFEQATGQAATEEGPT